MAVKNGSKVKIEYTGTLEDGTVFDTSKNRAPLEFQAGRGQVIPGFENAVIGMKRGEEKDIRIPPAEAYGEHDPALQRAVPKEHLPRGLAPKPGVIIGVALQDGSQIPAKITAVDEKTVTLDMNHPLAGKVLNFRIKVVEVEG